MNNDDSDSEDEDEDDGERMREATVRIHWVARESVTGDQGVGLGRLRESMGSPVGRWRDDEELVLNGMVKKTATEAVDVALDVASGGRGGEDGVGMTTIPELEAGEWKRNGDVDGDGDGSGHVAVRTGG